MKAAVEAVFGVPMYGPGKHAREALESLLGQTFASAALVIVDDGGGNRDHVADLLSDPRVRYVRNDRRLGLAANWRRTFVHARVLHPRAPYFAWGSDHDVWHPHWLEQLIRELDRDPDAVLAYPRFATITGLRTQAKGRRFESRHLSDPAQRLIESYPRLEPGYMVYGLYRAAALERCGVFRSVLVPDRLLLAELAVLGPFLQVPERLWNRRLVGSFSLARQRRTFFPDGLPAHARLPWWLVHVAVFGWTVGVRSPAAGRREALRLSLIHARLCLTWAWEHWRRKRLPALRRASARLAAKALHGALRH